MSRMSIALVTGISVTASLLTPIAASAENTAACENPGYTVEEGTLDWGIKTTWRDYILKDNKANGKWTTTSNIKTNDEIRTGDDFQFIFPVDAAKTKLSVNKNGELQGAIVETQPGGISFIGHPEKENPKKYKLDSTFISPYVHINGKKASAGTSYVGHYVPGKDMEQYEDADRIPANRVEGKDTFTDGTVKDFKIEPDKKDPKKVTITFTSQDMSIILRDGTDSKKHLAEGVDIVFMGQYNENYKPEFDPFTVTLKATETCLDTTKATELKEEVQKDSLPSEYTVERGGESKLSDEYKAVFTKLHPHSPSNTDTKPQDSKPKEDGLGAGAIAGIVIGAIFGVLALLGAVFAALNPRLLASFLK